MENDRIVQQKSRRFAIRIVHLYRYLCDTKKEYVMSRQVLRCGTSIGANLAEAECSYSRKELLSKKAQRRYIGLIFCMKQSI